MDKSEIITRFQFLESCLRCDTQCMNTELPKLTAAERIAINQERGALLDYLNYLNGDLPLENVRLNLLETSINIQLKVLKINNYINKNSLTLEESKHV